MSALEQLRAALAEGRPSTATFLGLVRLLEQAEAEGKGEVATRYVGDHVASWPAACCAVEEAQHPWQGGREAPPRWASLVASAELSRAGLFLGDGARLLRSMPNLRTLSLQRAYLQGEDVARLAQLEPPPRLERLDLGMNALSPEALEVLWGSGWCRGLRSLRLSGNPLGDSGFSGALKAVSAGLIQELELKGCKIPLQRLTGEGHGAVLSQLTRLELHDNPVFDGGCRTLAELLKRPALVELDLSNTYIRGDGALALAEVAGWAQLQTLRLSHNPLRSEGGCALARGAWPALTRLELTRTWLDNAAVEALAANASLGQLQHLLLGKNQIGPSGAEALARSPHLINLCTLELAENRLADRGLIALAEAPFLGRLTALSLVQNHFGGEGVVALAGSPGAAGLRALDLSMNRVDAGGVVALATSPFLGGVKRLGLRRSRARAAGAEALAASTALGALEELDLRSSQLGDAGAAALARATGLPALRRLILHGNKIGDVGAAALAASPLLGRLEELDLGFNLVSAEARRVLEGAAAGHPGLRLTVSGNPKG